MKILFIILALMPLILLILYLLYWNKFKRIKMPNVCLITGGVKTGKTNLAVYLAIRKWKVKHFIWKIKKVLFRKKEEEPLLYSNIPLFKNIPHCIITANQLLRKTRFNYGSILLISEASLVADSMEIRDMTVNERINLFNKLVGHETRGGYLIYDTQCLLDVHYGIKRCVNSYIWIHSTIKFIPFIVIMKVREMMNDPNAENVVKDDVEDNTRLLIISKKYWKFYDRYYYSFLTDNLPIENTIYKIKNKKVCELKVLPTIRRFRTIDLEEDLKNEECK